MSPLVTAGVRAKGPAVTSESGDGFVALGRMSGLRIPGGEVRPGAGVGSLSPLRCSVPLIPRETRHQRRFHRWSERPVSVPTTWTFLAHRRLSTVRSGR